MDRSEPLLPREASTESWFLNLIFLLSGCAALICEISWSRQTGLLFGHTAQAAAVVLCAYFSGLALGYAVGARWTDRISPLKAWAAAELTAASWTCLIPVFLEWIENSPLMLLLSHDAAPVRVISRVTVCFLLLLPATTAFGLTLPLMAACIRSSFPANERRILIAWSLNTVGGFLGVTSATAVLLIALGVRGSSIAAAGLSALCGLAAWRIARRHPVRSQQNATVRDNSHPAALPDDASSAAADPVAEFAANRPPDAVRLRSAAAAAAAGFGVLALEILYTRLFSLVLHNSTYTFGTIVAVCLLGLAGGSFLAAAGLKRWPASRLAEFVSWAGALLIPLSLWLFASVTGLKYFDFGNGWGGYLFGVFLLVTLIVLPPIMMSGCLLPILWALESPRQAPNSRIVGHLTMINTLAGAAGAVGSAFLLLPMAGLWGSFAVVSALFWCTAAFLLLSRRRFRATVLSGLSWAALAMVTFPTDSDRTMTPSDSDNREQVVRRWNSSYGWIDVVRVPSSGVLKIRQNLHYRFGATGQSASREYRQARLPLLLHPDPQRIAFLGLGTGMTAAGAVPHREVRQMTIIELIPEVVDAARLLRDHNFGVVDDPRVTIVTDDARHALKTTPDRFDVIISDLFVPWESETGYLYTVEHYRLGRQRLRKGGLFCQWLPVYQLGTDELQIIADSFAAVFPQTTLWWGELSSRQPILALVGTDRTVEVSADNVNRRLGQVRAAGIAADDDIRSARHLLGRLAGRWQPIHPNRLNTDEHPLVEFLSPLAHRNRRLLHTDRLREFFDTVLQHLPEADIRFLPAAGQPVPENARRRRAWHRLILFGEPSDPACLHPEPGGPACYRLRQIRLRSSSRVRRADSMSFMNRTASSG